MSNVFILCGRLEINGGKLILIRDRNLPYSSPPSSYPEPYRYEEIETSVIRLQRRKSESDELQMRTFFAEGEIICVIEGLMGDYFLFKGRGTVCLCRWRSGHPHAKSQIRKGIVGASILLIKYS